MGAFQRRVCGCAAVWLLAGCGGNETPEPVSGPALPLPLETDAAGPPVAEAHLYRVVNAGGGRWVVRWRADGHDLPPVNEPFDMEVLVADAASGEPAAVELIADGAMPHHRHGLVRYPVVIEQERGRFVVEDMLLHMPGRWELYFDIVDDGILDRALDELFLE